MRVMDDDRFLQVHETKSRSTFSSILHQIKIKIKIIINLSTIGPNHELMYKSFLIETKKYLQMRTELEMKRGLFVVQEAF